jgi:hypothetical protein
MAIAMTSPPMLRLKRSAQSGTKAMTAAWQTVYLESCPMAYIFGGAEIDLSNMIAGDIINIRIRKQVVSGGALVMHDQKTFSDARPATHPSVHIAAIPDVYGVEIAMQQTAGALRNIDCEFFDAKRIGLS